MMACEYVKLVVAAFFALYSSNSGPQAVLASPAADVTNEYCEYETFAPKCAADEVVLISDAVYGRMSTGKCIPDKYASEVGCSETALLFVNQQCSGRPSCLLPVSHLVADHQGSCPASPFRSYLIATYNCVKVVTSSKRECRDSIPSIITNIGKEGYLSSYVTRLTGCGDDNNPWLLRAGAGQKIEISLLDFARSKDSEYNNDNNCLMYATIRDGDGGVSHPVCGERGQGIRTVFLSSSNTVEIRIMATTHRNGDRQFMLKYAVVGCSDPDRSDNMWIKRFGDEAMVGCKNDHSSAWLLTCKSGIWEGQTGVCSSSASGPNIKLSNSESGLSALPAFSFVTVGSSRVSDLSESKEAKAQPSTTFSENWSYLFKNSNLLLISGTAVFISVLFFILTILCVWSKHSRKSADNMPSNPPHPLHFDHQTYGHKTYSYARPSLPPSYEMYPDINTTTRNAPPKSAVQTAVYPFSDTSSTYNTVNVNRRLSSRDHVYESAMMASAVTVTDDIPRDDNVSEHKYFVLNSNTATKM